MILLRISLVSVTILLTACGGGSDKETSSAPEPVNPPPTSTENNQPTAFTDISAPDDFNWSMQTSSKIKMKLVSNFNDKKVSNKPLSADSQSASPQLDWMGISGTYIVKVFGVDQDDNVITTPIFTGITNKFGELPVTFNIPNNWLGIIVHVDLNDITCSQRVASSEIENLIAIGCDVSVSSDL